MITDRTMTIKLSEAWRTFSQGYSSWRSNRAHHPSAFVGCLDTRIASTLENMLHALGGIVMDNDINVDFAVLCKECDAIKMMTAGPDSARIRIFCDGLLKHTGGDFIKTLEAHLIKFEQDFRHWPWAATHISMPNSLEKLADHIKKMKSPPPPPYLLKFYEACLGLCWSLGDLLEAIRTLRRDGKI